MADHRMAHGFPVAQMELSFIPDNDDAKITAILVTLHDEIVGVLDSFRVDRIFYTNVGTGPPIYSHQGRV